MRAKWDSVSPASALQVHLIQFHLCLRMAQGAEVVPAQRKKHGFVGLNNTGNGDTQEVAAASWNNSSSRGLVCF